MNTKNLLLSLALGFSLVAVAQTKKEENPLKVSVGSNALKSPVLEPHQVTELEVELTLPPGYKAYEEQFKLTFDGSDDFKVGKMSISPIHEFFDDYSKKQRRGMKDKAILKAVVEAPATIKPEGKIVFKLMYQACTKTYCLFPKAALFEVNYRGAGAVVDEKSAVKPLLSSNFEEVFEKGLLWTFLLVFLAGLLTSFTPCVFPMIPITIAVLTKDAQKRTRLQSVILSSTYVLGIALTYAVLGVVAASTGSLFGSLLSSTWFLGLMCAIFLAMAFSLFGYFELEPPSFIRERLSRSLGNGGGGLVNAFLSGIVAGVVASPCVGPVLVGILTYVAQSKNLWLGFWLLFVFALGMGMLFLVIGISTQATKLLPRSGAWMNGVKHLSGVMMLGVFYYYLSFLLEQRWHDLALGFGLVILGSLGGAFGNAKSNFDKIKKGLCLAFILSGAALLVIGALDLRPQLSSKTISGGSPSFNVNTLNWKPLTKEALAESVKKGRPIMIDFYADWCAACHELEKLTFTNQRVQLLAVQFDLYRFDATKESPELEAFRKQFGIVGLPWVIFLDRQGKWLKENTLTGFEEAAPFTERLNKALK